MVDSGGVETSPRFIPFAETVSDKHSPHQIDEALDHIRINLNRGLPEVESHPGHGKTLLIVGSAPSLAETVEQLRETEGDIIALNEAHDWLLNNGICPRFYGQMEISPWPRDVLTMPQDDCTYLLPSMSSPDNYDRLKGYDVRVWHAWTGCGEDRLLEGKDLVCGSGIFAIRAINLGLYMGYRKFEMFGCDACFRESSHVDQERPGARSDALDAEWNGKRYQSAHYLLKGVHDLRRLCERFHHLFSLKCHGDGLMQTVHRDLYPKQY